MTARAAGFRITVVLISTEAPAINVERVRRRVLEGGHDVPTDRILARHAKTMALAPAYLMAADEAYVFDTSRDGTSSREIAPELQFIVRDGWVLRRWPLRRGLLRSSPTRRGASAAPTDADAALNPWAEDLAQRHIARIGELEALVGAARYPDPAEPSIAVTAPLAGAAWRALFADLGESRNSGLVLVAGADFVLQLCLGPFAFVLHDRVLLDAAAIGRGLTPRSQVTIGYRDGVARIGA